MREERREGGSWAGGEWREEREEGRWTVADTCSSELGPGWVPDSRAGQPQRRSDTSLGATLGSLRVGTPGLGQDEPGISISNEQPGIQFRSWGPGHPGPG